ncbi:MAG: alpha-L-fucosidase [Opitutaceae bacterium]|nr:alpha-L-fucosidase [Opitutaceae bacterium]
MNPIQSFLLSVAYIGCLAAQSLPAAENAAQRDARMTWWREAKFGMFIHWGPSALLGGVWNGQPVDGGVGNGYSEWIMYNAKIPVADYARAVARFNPVKFDADQWVRLAKQAGQKYIVITAKHHDGFAMFKTAASRFNLIEATPFKRDPLRELADACRRHGMRLGFYYSQAQDWHHPGGSAYNGTWDGGAPAAGRWDPAQDADMDAYLDRVAVPQVRELLTRYGPVAVFWWDTPVGMTRSRAEKLAPLLALQPGIISNNRLGNRIEGGFLGDTETPEQFIPATGFSGRDWETCMTMNKSWGFRANDQNWKSTEELVFKLVDIVSKGGNFLLNIGPDAEGVVPAPSVERLEEIGRWMERNGEAIYGAAASPFPFLSWGRCTRKGQTLYLHVFDWPVDGQLRVPLRNEIARAHLLAAPDRALPCERDGDVRIIRLPADAPDAPVTVVALQIEGEPQTFVPPTLAKPAKTSSEDPSHAASAAVDGHTETFWAVAAGEKQGWIEVDLGQPMPVICCTFSEPFRPGDKSWQKYALEAQVDGRWQTVVAGRTNGHGAEQRFAPVTAREFRLRLTAKESPSIAEWQLFCIE